MLRIALILMCLMTQPVFGGVAEDAGQAAADLQTAVDALGAAEGAKDRIAALTQTIRAYEQGLAALRGALRQAEQRQVELMAEFEAKRDSIAQLLGVLARIEAEPGPLLMIHPTGPLGTVRSGMMLADVTPALQAQAEGLRGKLTELESLRTLQTAAGRTLTAGLDAAQSARSALAQAISQRTDLPRKFTEDPDVLRGLLESADTLDAFASGLALDADAGAGFVAAKGTLDLPVLGTVLLRPFEVDARGVSRPGISIAARPASLVTAPWAATIRYLGPLLDYGNVIILEPGDGYLLIIAGLHDVFGAQGEVIAKGAALGLMGGTDDAAGSAGSGQNSDLLAPTKDGGGAHETETLYLELRQGAEPVDLTDWFAATAKAL